MRLSTLAILATTVAAAIGAAATPGAAMQLPARSTQTTLVTRVADLDRPAATGHRRKARFYRYRRAYGYWRVRPIVITPGHPLHYFPGEIVYTYYPPDCCCCRGW